MAPLRLRGSMGLPPSLRPPAIITTALAIITTRLLGHHHDLQPSSRQRLPSLRQDFFTAAIVTAPLLQI
jgi:hypothetical protein